MLPRIEILGRNIIALTCLQLVGYLVPLLAVPLLTRRLGVSAFGSLAVAQSAIFIFVFLSEYGFPWSATRRIASQGNDIAEIRRVFTETFLVQLCLTTISCVALVAWVLSSTTLHTDALVVLSGGTALFGACLFPMWFYQGRQLLKQAVPYQLAARILTLPLIYLFVRHSGDAAVANFIPGACLAIAGISCWLFLGRREGMMLLFPLNAKSIARSAIDGWPSFMTKIAVMLYTTALPLLIGLISTNFEAGNFQLADKVRLAVTSLLTPVASALYPRMASLAISNQVAALRLAGRTLMYGGPLAIIFGCVMLFFADQIVLEFAGPEFVRAAIILRWMAPLPFLIFVSNILGVQIMLAFGLSTEVMKISALAAVFCLALSEFFIGRSGGVGAAQVSLATEILIDVLMAIVLVRKDMLPKLRIAGA